MTLAVHVVPHTHWDREWYEPFESFRLRLVELVENLLEILEGDPSFTHFQLDGQMAVVDDFLELRPDQEERLRRLVASGRISVGPWYTLPDEFLVSGETLVRNLQLGVTRAAAFGGPMPIGYLPDMFGHIAQMPQLLKQMGFEHAVVWRGVPSAIRAEAFWWEAPDGSRVRAEYLPEGYGNGAHLPPDGAELVEQVRRFVAKNGEYVGEAVLWMQGTDHQMPDRRLPRLLEEARSCVDGMEFAITSLEEHLASARRDGLPVWRGELRSSARANLLMGVASNRVDVKLAAAKATAALERHAEPLCALFDQPARWPAAELDHAWLEVVRNSAHDSICACSHDDVCREVLARYARAATVAFRLAERALDTFGGSLASRGPVVVNTTPRPRSAVVEVDFDGEPPADAACEGVQLLDRRPTVTRIPVPPQFAATLAAWISDERGGVSGHRVEQVDGVLKVTLRRAAPGEEREKTSRVIADIEAEAHACHAAVVELVRPPRWRALAFCGLIPGFGWSAVRREPLGVPPVEVSDHEGGVSLRNGRLEVKVRPDGLWDMRASDGGGGPGTSAAGLGRLVDGGDAGDTYNWCPPHRDVVVDRPERVVVEVLERGPLRGRVRIRATFRWPERIENGERTGSRDVEVTTVLQLRADEDFVRVSTALRNECRHHRLRVHFPLPEPADHSLAECAFDVVRRGLEAEGGLTEMGLPTWPSRRFVRAGGLTFIHEGLHEYELVDVRDGVAHELAVTLLRSVDVISRGPMPTRPLPAGPPVHTPEALLLRDLEFSYAVHVGSSNPFELADEFLVEPHVVHGSGGGSTPETGSMLELSGAEVSAVRREGGLLQVRIFNPTDEDSVVQLPGRRGWLVDLAGRTLGEFDGSVPLGPHAIATLMIT
ncbi:MAG: alpha-mannosidase [Acidimicrobiales bacterium]|nr:MAG: alpha-mannosidase [Acidimicrobiales bacterium]